MYVITFYSFKGGVGRTMALVNVAAELVRRGRKVLVVDFDLEAPGLETYKHLHPPKPHPGIVEYVTEFGRTQAVPNLLDYIYETKPIGKKGGRLWVMPAGRRDRAYHSALANLDWQRLYKQEEGFLLFEDTKAGWEQELKPDYVFIDSRTGDTDVKGICTRQLPNSVVLMFTPNEQNLAGLENVCRDIRREETEGLKKRIRLHFVAANVPNLDDEKRILRRQVQAFRDRLDFKDLSGVIRRYENLNLLDQSVFILDRPHTRLARSYRRLLRTLLKDNPTDRDGAMFFLEDYPEDPEKLIQGNGWGRRNGEILVPDQEGRFGPSGPHLEYKRRLREIARHFNGDAEILKQVAERFVWWEDFRNAVEMFDRALEAKPNFAEALLRRAFCKAHLGEIEEAAEDLLACLRLPASDEKNQLGFLKQTCLQRYCAVAPKKSWPKLAEIIETQSIRGMSHVTVAHILCDREEGIPIAARLLRKCLAGSDEASKDFLSTSPLTLLRARCWNEVIDMLEAPEIKCRAGGLLYLALAYWGEHGAMPEQLCRQTLEALETEPGVWGFSIFEARSWLLWCLDDVAGPLAYLEKAEQQAYGVSENVLSLWRLRYVTPDQYLDDCRFVRRMIQGEPIRPAFLGEPATPAVSGLPG
ncbi:hypothetical protein AYO44_18735 [Planctomycetaceae bacterium SCGC AG-212-F19]|nr:hypothetical protein AYO44_18735 [Planctomycetaceae bacterium SCGC AG-212-F19]